METETVKVDVSNCPSVHSRKNKVGRILWRVVYLCCFRLTPQPFHGWRRFILRLFGAKISRTAQVFPRVRIWAPWNLVMHDYATLSNDVDCYSVAMIELGPHSTVSQEAFLCSATHDVRSRSMALVMAPIRLEHGAWVCARAFIGPGVTLHEGAVAGACAVVMKDVASYDIVAGNPATVIKKRNLDRD